MQAGAFLACAGGLMAAFAPAGARAFYVAAIFVGALANSLVGPPHMAFTLRIYPRGRRVGYGALSGLALTPVALVAAPAAGIVMDGAGHAALFALAAAATMASLLPLGRCQEPPHEPPAP
jgi:MFS family permease